MGAIVGDIAHNLRSALDVAAWHLALDFDEPATRANHLQVKFPLERESGGFKKQSALKYVSCDARAVFESLQPYQPNMEALGWLRDISNSDKHRVAVFTITGISALPAQETGVHGFSNPHLLFATEEGHLGLIGLWAIAVSVESALTDLEALATP